MAGGAGYRYSFIVYGSETSWKNIEFTGSNPGVDTTSRLLPDGTTNDPACADREPDVNTFTITLTEMARAADDVRGDITSAGAAFVEGERDPDAPWSVEYDGVELASGTGLYCSEGNFTGQIPGEARTVYRFQAIGLYTRN